MSDATKAPVRPGFIVLTHATGVREPLPIQRVVADWAWVADNNREVPFVNSPARILNRQYRETWAEVAALIAEAEAAERRARALPVMAAIVMQAQVGCSREDWQKANAKTALGTASEILMHHDPHEVAFILDAIERREGSDD